MSPNYKEAKSAIDNILTSLNKIDFLKEFRKPDSDKYHSELLDFLDSHLIQLPKNISYTCGSSRIVIWDNIKCDYVMKISLVERQEEYNQKEVSIYSDAVENECEEAFAWCKEIYEPGELGPRGIYAMEYIECDEASIEDSHYSYEYSYWCSQEGRDEYEEEAQRDFSAYYYDVICENDNLLEWVLRDFSRKVEQTVWKLRNKWEIGDIHAGNVGYKNGQLVLIDYTGFWG